MHPPEPVPLGAIHQKKDKRTQNAESELGKQDEVSPREIHTASDHRADSSLAKKHLRDREDQESELERGTPARKKDGQRGREDHSSHQIPLRSPEVSRGLDEFTRRIGRGTSARLKGGEERREHSAGQDGGLAHSHPENEERDPSDNRDRGEEENRCCQSEIEGGTPPEEKPQAGPQGATDDESRRDRKEGLSSGQQNAFRVGRKDLQHLNDGGGERGHGVRERHIGLPGSQQNDEAGQPVDGLSRDHRPGGDQIVSSIGFSIRCLARKNTWLSCKPWRSGSESGETQGHL